MYATRNVRINESNGSTWWQRCHSFTRSFGCCCFSLLFCWFVCSNHPLTSYLFLHDHFEHFMDWWWWRWCCYCYPPLFHIDALRTHFYIVKNTQNGNEKSSRKWTEKRRMSWRMRACVRVCTMMGVELKDMPRNDEAILLHTAGRYMWP